MKKLTLFLLVLSFMFLQWGIADASIAAMRTSPDNLKVTTPAGGAASNPRAVFKHLNEKQLLGLTIYAESRKNSSIEGRNAVGSVVLERNDFYRWGVKKIILQPRWFSCFNPGDRGFRQLKGIALNFTYYLKRIPSLQESYLVAEMLLNKSLPRHKVIAANGVQHFATVNCENNWIRKMTVVAVLDGHKFLSESMTPRIDHRVQNSLSSGYSKNITPQATGYVCWMEEPVRTGVLLI